jgi:hypothetical protein
MIAETPTQVVIFSDRPGKTVLVLKSDSNNSLSRLYLVVYVTGFIELRKSAQSLRAAAVNGTFPEREKLAALALAQADLLLDQLGERVGVFVAFTPLAILIRDFARADEYTGLLISLAVKNSMPHWEQYGYVYKARIDIAKGNVADAITQFDKFAVHLKNNPTHLATSEKTVALLNDLILKNHSDVVENFVTNCLEERLNPAKSKKLENWLKTLRENIGATLD